LGLSLALSSCVVECLNLMLTHDLIIDIMLGAQLVGWLRENWPKHFESAQVTLESLPDSDRCCRTVLLHFDHMRSRASYSKTLAGWTSELGIVGRLVFCDKLIIALMQGPAIAVKVCCACHINSRKI